MSYFSNHSFAGQKALIRVDFNVPLDKETRAVTDDTRIKGAIPTLVKIIQDGGSVILMSHLGRPKEGPEEKSSLKHVIPTLQLLIDKATGHHINIDFANDCIGAEASRNQLLAAG